MAVVSPPFPSFPSPYLPPDIPLTHTPATPKPKATPKKRATKENDGEATGSPAKKARTPAKKGKGKSEAKVKEEEGGEDEEMS